MRNQQGVTFPASPRNCFRKPFLLLLKEIYIHMSAKQTRKSHRHFLAAPLAILAISLSLLSGALPSSTQSGSARVASVMEFSEGEVLSLPGGMQSLLYSGKGFTVSSTEIVLEEGTALLSGNGVLVLTVGQNHLSALSGAFYVAYQGGDMTVAALSAPVVVRSGSRLMIVPVGTQWRSSADATLPLLQAGYPLWLRARHVTPFPERFLVRQLQNLAFLPKRDFLPPVRSLEPAAFRTTFSALKIGTSREQAQQAWQQQIFGTVRHLAEVGDAGALSAFFLREEYADALVSPEAVDMYARLLAGEKLDSSVRSLLLTRVIQDEDVWLAASLHPHLREETWSLFSQHTNPEALALRLFFLPLSNVGPSSVSASAMQRWVYELGTFAHGDKATALVHAILELHLPLVSRFEEQGYPERSRILADALITLVRNTGVTLPEELAEQMVSLKELDHVQIVNIAEAENTIEAESAEEKNTDKVKAEPKEVSEGEKGESVDSYSPEVIEERAYIVLRDMGALFTVQTSIDAVAPNTARIQEVIFASPQGDRTVTMLFDVAKGEVSQISIGHKEYPYALSLQAFAEWIRK
ncbi:hypothetical protein COU76_01640 [Candidatus Peregrinibacteria bacterium CG10_big_fil_rev_8_21_14_0_10_49_10]|nr:MAG: hypothetical protein COU76_01640 [Candidatus Peregrinibacteria bacterium CG10_big_fil_rev_8_21_14_0_10_49_10]